MKEVELREHARCSMCKNKIGASGMPFFYTVKIERYGLDLRAIQSQDGLASFLGGSSVLARVMGPDKDLAHAVQEPSLLTVCERCASMDILRISDLNILGLEKPVKIPDVDPKDLTKIQEGEDRS